MARRLTLDTGVVIRAERGGADDKAAFDGLPGVRASVLPAEPSGRPEG
ncbi:hypothetical protein ACFV0Z_22520 [Streptomyces xiamenensis]